ncbi:hypothetical protein Pfo_006854 [Paulownia fortunei]|nr:hypothetical protein Pfo_006854 [Paulownia fortunei]
MEKSCFHIAFSALILLKCFAVCCFGQTAFNLTTDEEALLAFKSRITSDPLNIMANNWSTTSSTSICSWVGVSCGANQRITALRLYGLSLGGTIAPHLGNMTFLSSLDLSFNRFTGLLPDELARLRRLKEIHLEFNNFTGDVPLWLGNLSILKSLDMKYNQLTGSIPSSIFNISSLERFDLTSNSLSGPIPVDMCDNLPRLEGLSFSVNQLSGSIPSNLYKCRALQHLSLSFNQFNGSIPREIGELTMLKKLYLGANNFEGGIPPEIGNLSNLELFSMRQSSLTGKIPSFIFNISSLKHIDLAYNGLSGSLPLDIHHNLPNLEQLYLQSNRLTGQILSGLLDCNKLWLLQLTKNQFTGAIPKQVGNMTQLKILYLRENNMKGTSRTCSGILELSSNHFNGQLPANIGSSLPNLELLFLNNNSLSGSIPRSISNATKLSIIDIGSNSFTGLIPDFGNLRLLQRLVIPENNLTGESPNQELRFVSSLQNCQHLEMLEVSLNQLNGILPHSVGNLSTSLQMFRAFGCNIKGSIPAEIGNLSSLKSIDLDNNELTGFIPTELGKLKQVELIYLEHNRLEGRIPTDLCQINRLGDLYLSGNMLNGTIPACLGKLKSLRRVFLDSNRLTSVVPNLWSLTDLWESLVTLSFAHNNLQGSIPQSLGDLRGLESLDLSNNNLSGSIPKSLEKLNYIQYFDLSHNRLEGEIPTGGCFANFSAKSFMHNYALCGVPRFQVPPCKVQTVKRSSSKHVTLIKYIMVPIISAIFAVAITLWLVRRRRVSKKQLHAEISPLLAWRRVSYQELLQATEGFSEVNLLGSGSFGSVFRGTLSDGLNVAVKVFNLQLERAIKSFDVECEVLSTVRHRNLVRVISCCCNTDFKALVLEYMPNGSLEKWLYSHNYCLDLLQRLNISIDVAVALEYLHHGNIFPIVHCDLKPSNILLDEDMTAHVGDFGISKLFGEGEATSQTITLATFGYMAPEYGSEGKVSIVGDVYSYGIMLLEIFTRKKPTDDMFTEEMSLKDLVSEALQENAVTEIVAPGLLAREDQHFSAKEQCISSIFGLAMECLTFSPEERINMIEMVAALKKIRATFLTSTRRHHQVTHFDH